MPVTRREAFGGALLGGAFFVAAIDQYNRSREQERQAVREKYGLVGDGHPDGILSGGKVVISPEAAVVSYAGTPLSWEAVQELNGAPVKGFRSVEINDPLLFIHMGVGPGGTFEMEVPWTEVVVRGVVSLDGVRLPTVLRIPLTTQTFGRDPRQNTLPGVLENSSFSSGTLEHVSPKNGVYKSASNEIPFDQINRVSVVR